MLRHSFYLDPNYTAPYVHITTRHVTSRCYINNSIHYVAAPAEAPGWGIVRGSSLSH